MGVPHPALTRKCPGEQRHSRSGSRRAHPEPAVSASFLLAWTLVPRTPTQRWAMRPGHTSRPRRGFEGGAPLSRPPSSRSTRTPKGPFWNPPRRFQGRERTSQGVQGQRAIEGVSGPLTPSPRHYLVWAGEESVLDPLPQVKTPEPTLSRACITGEERAVVPTWALTVLGQSVRSHLLGTGDTHRALVPDPSLGALPGPNSSPCFPPSISALGFPHPKHTPLPGSPRQHSPVLPLVFNPGFHCCN